MRNNCEHKFSAYKRLLLNTIFILFTVFLNAQCWKNIYPGRYHTLTIKSNGTLWSAGDNDYGQLGDGTFTDKLVQTQVGTATDWKEVFVGPHSTVALKNNGTIWGFGWNYYYQLGIGTVIDSNVPVQIGTTSDWKQVSIGDLACAAIKTNGTLWTWGSNYNGILGNGSTANYTNYAATPVQIGTDTNWKIVSLAGNAGGNDYALAIKNDGTLWGWGKNYSGALGSGGNKYVPTQISIDTDWVDVKVTGGGGVATKSDGSRWAWGFNTYGSYGNGNNISSSISTPAYVGNVADWEKISVGSLHTLAIKNDGTLWAWGYNDYGQLGTSNYVSSNIPIQIGVANDWKNVFAGWQNSYAIKNNYSLFDTGFNGQGQLMNGTISNYVYQNTFQQVTSTNCPPFLSISAVDDSASTQSGIISVPISNVLSNDTYNGSGATFSNVTLTQISSTNSGVNLNNTTGAITVEASVFSGTYTLVYQICALDNSANCNSATVTITVLPGITAISDSGTAINGIASISVSNVRSNDNYDGLPATSTNTNLSFISSTNSGITLNTTTGAVSITATVPVGTYTLIYRICAVDNPTYCADGIVTITVEPRIDAIDDFGTATYGIASITVPNVRINDTYDNVSATSINTTLSLISTSNPGIALNTTTGAVSVASTVLAGTYTLVYNLCNGTNCDSATVNISVYLPTPNSVTGIRADNIVNNIGLQSNGKIIITGVFKNYNNISSRTIARLNTDLTLDQTFLATGPTPEDIAPFDMLIQPDDKIILVFASSETGFNGGFNGRGIIRLNANGTVDTSFNVGGVGLSLGDNIRACALQPDGKILIGGAWMSSFNGQNTETMIRLNSDGSIDNTFHFPFSKSLGTANAIYKIVVQPNGKILVGGNGNPFPSVQKNVFRLNSDGSIDNSFIDGYTGDNVYNNGTSSICTSCYCPIENIVLQSDNKIIVVGAFNSYNGVPKSNIVRLNVDGSIDGSFNPPSTSDRVIKDVALDGTGRMFIGGEFKTYNGASVNKIIRLTPTGINDLSFNSGTGTAHTNTSGPSYNNIHALKLQSDGKLIIGGSFTSYNGISATNITRLQPSIAGGQAKSGSVYWESEIEIDINNQNNIVVYPNPSKGILNIDLENVIEKYDTLEVFNLMGQIVHKEILVDKSTNTIDISKLPDGYYIVKIKNDVKSVQIKLIKK